MPIAANSTTSYNVTSIREDVVNEIFMVENEEFPLTSGIKRKKAGTRTPEILTHGLEAANGANAALEGDISALDASAQPTRLGNVMQIFKYVYGVSGSTLAFDLIGRKTDEMARVRAHNVRRMKRDMESAFLSASASVAGADATARRLGGLEALIRTNVSSGSGYVNGTHTGNAVGAPTDGTPRAFTQVLLDGIMPTSFSNGAKPSELYMGPTQKNVFSTFVGIAANRVDLGKAGKGTERQGVLTTGVDMYQSNFGPLMAVPSTFMRNRTVLGVDRSAINMRYAPGRLMLREELAKDGDYDREHLITECTIEVENQRSQFKIADLT